jgi:hypothetical protein
MDLTDKDDGINDAGVENLARLESNLQRNTEALHYLRSHGISDRTIEKFRLGIKEPYRRKADGLSVANLLCYPLLSTTGDPLGRYGYCNIPGITKNFEGAQYSSPGRARTYHHGDVVGKVKLFVAGNCQDLWVIDQHLSLCEHGGKILVVTSTHGDALPDEWMIPAFWASWGDIYLGLTNDGIAERLIDKINRRCGREARRVRIPQEMGRTWADFFLAGGNAERFEKLLDDAELIPGPQPLATENMEQPGEFAANPININGAFANGYLYYPFTVERRELWRRSTKGANTAGELVTSYVTKIVRSDGAVLDIVRLPAPKGTPPSRQVLALTDGTRIEREPQPTHYATWQLESIQEFIKDAQNGTPTSHRPLKELLAGVSEHLRASVWLPFESDYSLLTLYVALSFVYQVFDAIPLVMVSGDKGTGKSELGDAIARVSCNATVIGQGSAAGVVRLLNDARGLVVLDDMEAIGRTLEGSAFGDISQMLKLSYKKRTGRKAITGKDGKTTVFDFFGPKVVNNTRGVGPILGSRMIHIRTRKITGEARVGAGRDGGDPEELMRLRDELHTWGMSKAPEIRTIYLRLMDSRTDREQEIMAPLRALAEIADDTEIKSSLERAIEHQNSRLNNVDEPVEMLKEAVANCVRCGAVESLTSAQLRLELGLVAEQNMGGANSIGSPEWLQPEWVGQKLFVLGFREPGVRVRRVRLYGLVTRIYELRKDLVDGALRSHQSAHSRGPVCKRPLAFCEENACGECVYNQVCHLIIPGLKEAKRLHRGRNSQAHATGQALSPAIIQVGGRARGSS